MRGLADVVWVVVHHTGTGPARPTIYDTDAWQISPSAQAAFPGCAYLGYVEADGSFELAWDLETETWSQGIGSPSEDANGEGVNNEKGLAFCFSGDNPTDAQRSTLIALHDVAQIVVARALLFTSHGNVDPGTTECAGTVVNAWLAKP